MYTRKAKIRSAYVSLTNPVFTGKVKVDFTWSIPFNLDMTGMATFLASNT